MTSPLHTELPPDARVAFVADQFADAPRTRHEPYPGGAELTDAAALEVAPVEVTCLRSAELEPAQVRDFDLLILGNADALSAAQVHALATHGRHVLFEHDLRLCRWRGNFPLAPDRMHRLGATCTCPNPTAQALFTSALGAIFLTETQRRHYAKNPYYSGAPFAVLGSSLMNRAFFADVDRRNAEGPREREHKVTVCYSRSASKGFEEAKAFCRERGQEPFVIRHLRPDEVLEVLANSRNFVYLPQSFEAAGRMPLEARFLGANAITNRVTGIASEPWWQLDDAAALSHVRSAPERFWRHIGRFYQRGARTNDAPPSLTSLSLQKVARRPVATALSVGRAALEFSPFYAHLGRAAETLERAQAQHQAAQAPLEPSELV